MSKRLSAAILILLLLLSACSPAKETNSTLTTSPSPIGSTNEENDEADERVKPAFYDMTTAFESSDDLINNVEVIQVMAKGLDSDTGEFYDMYRYVAGKNTIIRGVFSEQIDVAQDGSLILYIRKNDEEVAELLPINTGVSNYAYFAPRNISDVDNWSPGKYEFEMTFHENYGIRTASFNEAKKIKVLAVPVLANYGGNVVGCEGEWQTAITFTRDTYPLASDGIDYVLGNELDLSGDSFDLTTNEGMYNVWNELSNLQTPSNDYELILGFVRERQGEESNVQGYTYGKPANIITESDGDMMPTVAHEIAHCYLVGDEYPGGSINNAVNPPPYEMEGSDWNNRESTTYGMKQAVVSANDIGNPNTGSLVRDEQAPMNATQMTLLSKIGSFMGSGSSELSHYWITSDIWNQLHKAFVPGAGDDSMSTYTGIANAEEGSGSGGTVIDCKECYKSAPIEKYQLYARCNECDEFTVLDITQAEETFNCEECGKLNELGNDNVFLLCPSCDEIFQFNPQTDLAQKQAVQKNSSTEITVIDISGTLYANGRFEAKPWYTYTSDSSSIDKAVKGDYSVLMEDASGKKLSQQDFNVSFYTQGNPPKKNDFTPVNLSLKYNTNTATIKIMQGNKVLYTQNVSKNKPKVELAKVSAQYSGKAEISWTASDADNDKLYYELWYCTDDETFTNLANNITETKYTVNFDSLPGTKQGYFYLYATDGVNTAEADSDYFAVSYKAPQIITKQDKVPQYKLTDEIMLDADVYDMQDGWLYTDDEIEWTYNGRAYTTGSLLWVFPYELTPGEHVFTLTAKNSDGVKISQEFKFAILDDESALPKDWSKEDVKSALSNGFVAPLSNINAAITRGQFAKLMANLYWAVWEEGAPDPDYEENLVKDCGTDDYDQFLMVKLGVMEAPNGKFNPNANITQEEAAIAIYKICSIADPEVAEPTDDKAEMVEICMNSGVMDETGDNAYSAKDKITGRLALVRCNRTYEAIFE